MNSSKKVILVIFLIISIGTFGYSQYASASQIDVNITQSKLLNENEKGANYDLELKFENPSLLLLTAGETEFIVIVNEEIVGNGQLEPFTLQPLDSSFVRGSFHTNSNIDKESESVKITGTTTYDIVFTSIDVPFVYYPTQEQAREFIHQQ